MKTKFLTLLLVALGLLASAATALTQTTTFTYQGRLTDNSQPANGSYDLRFALCDAAAAGGTIGTPVTNAPVVVTNGLFTVTLDFGSSAFTNAGRWLEIGVRTNGSTGAHSILSPRQAITSSPYAIYTMTAEKVIPDGLLAGTYGKALAFTNGANSFRGTFTGDGSGLTNLPSQGGNNVFTSGLKLKQGPAGATTWDVSVVNFTDSEGGVHPDTLVFSTSQGFRMGIDTAGGVGAAGEISTPSHVSAGSNVYATHIYASGDVHAARIYGVVNPPSDRNLKEKFAPIDNRDILERVIGLPISSWTYKSDATTRHIGPMAQDFYAAFNVGPDDKHIATVDADGVVLAAIQGLNQIVQEKDTELQTLKQRLAALEELVQSITK